MDNYSLIPLFSSPLYVSNIGSFDDKVKHFLMSLPNERMSSNNGSYSKNKKVLDFDLCADLKQQILQQVNFYAHNIIEVDKSVEFYITNSWVNKHHKNDWGQTHIHTNCIFSGCLYIECDNESGDIFFEKSLGLNNCIPSTIDLPCSNWNIFNSKVWRIKPSVGTIVLFPSNMPHSVAANKSDIERYSLAFNVFVKGKIGSDVELCQLEL